MVKNSFKNMLVFLIMFFVVATAQAGIQVARVWTNDNYSLQIHCYNEEFAGGDYHVIRLDDWINHPTVYCPKGYRQSVTLLRGLYVPDYSVDYDILTDYVHFWGEGGVTVDEVTLSKCSEGDLLITVNHDTTNERVMTDKDFNPIDHNNNGEADRYYWIYNVSSECSFMKP